MMEHLRWLQQNIPPISAKELELLWVDYPKFGEYDQLIRLDRIPKGALDRILEYTDKEFPAFRQYLQRDIERYQEPKKWWCVPSPGVEGKNTRSRPEKKEHTMWSISPIWGFPKMCAERFSRPTETKRLNGRAPCSCAERCAPLLRVLVLGSYRHKEGSRAVCQAATV